MRRGASERELAWLELDEAKPFHRSLSQRRDATSLRPTSSNQALTLGRLVRLWFIFIVLHY